ncbi:hypothetical protein D3C85_1901520 [compost metagenome]
MLEPEMREQKEEPLSLCDGVHCLTLNRSSIKKSLPQSAGMQTGADREQAV